MRYVFLHLFFSLLLIHLLSSLAAISTANLRPERVKKTRAAVSPCFSFSLNLYLSFFPGKVSSSFQGTVKSEDDIAEFLEDSASPKCNDCGPDHSFNTCPSGKDSAANTEAVSPATHISLVLNLSNTPILHPENGYSCNQQRCSSHRH